MRTRNRAVIAFMATLSLLMGSLTFVSASPPSANDGEAQASEDSEAEISVEFFDGCTDFHVESSKDISFVSINFEDDDFTYLKFEGDDIETEDQDRDGDDPDGSDLQDFSFEGDTDIKSVVVKSGSTMLVFNCPDDGEGEVVADPEEEPECSDGRDNDGDGRTDHPDDSGCETPDDDDERPGDGDNGDDTEGPQGDATCDDGVDNDGDGFVDGEDPDCNEGAQDGAFCDDGVDNDGDGDVDGADSDCPDDGTEGPQGDATCDDGVDNDGDGFVDGEDPDCNEGAQDGAFCDDGVDNDGDGDVDGADSDCPEDEPDPCTADAGDPGILTDDTLGQTAWDGGLQAPPLTEDPDADGLVTGPVHDGGDGTPLEPVTDEASCAGDLLVDQEASPVDP